MSRFIFSIAIKIAPEAPPANIASRVTSRRQPALLAESKF